MNITKDIHLAHTKFTVDKDAYVILETYLNKLSNAFISNISREEILEDIEIRLAEIFSEKRSNENFVISIKEINAAIEILGSPELLAEEEEIEASDPIKKNSNRKFYRDLEDKYIAGVSSGLSHYFGIKPVWLRVLFIVFFIIPIPLALITYLILWIITPAAKTNADKIRMRGEAVNLASIKKKIHENISKIDNAVENDEKAFVSKLKHFLNKTISFLKITIENLAKLLTTFIGVFMIISSLVSGLINLSFVVFISAVKSGVGTAENLSYSFLPQSIKINDELSFYFSEFFSSFNSIFTIIFLALLLIIPCVFLFIVGLKLVSKNNYTIQNRTFYILIAMWFISFMYFIYIFTISAVNLVYVV